MSGVPRDLQNLVGLSPYSPPTNTLGSYHIAAGWFEGVQIQADISGETGYYGSDWTDAQTALVYGTIRIRAGQPAKVVYNSNPNDSPPAYAVFQGLGTFDWLDTPGWRVAPGSPLYFANLTFDFTSTLTDLETDASCSVSWGFKLSILGNKWSITPF
jgi:hypothetical protein